jgi:hypothetical protein
MKLGVFGDSFAMNHPDNPSDSWVDIVGKKYTTTNWASPGTNLFYSMVAFKNNQHEYDKIIFVVTMPGRLFLRHDEIYDSDDDRKVASLTMAEYLYNKSLNEVDGYKKETKLKIYRSAADYLAYIQDDVYERYIHWLMVRDILTIRPDAILIPTVSDSLENYHGDVMVDITIKEDIAFNYTPNIYHNDIRNCHMTKENNEIFAGKVEEWLNGNPVYIDINDFVAPNNTEFYIKKL